jgi:hypothetical protein
MKLVAAASSKLLAQFAWQLTASSPEHKSVLHHPMLMRTFKLGTFNKAKL